MTEKTKIYKFIHLYNYSVLRGKLAWEYNGNSIVYKKDMHFFKFCKIVAETENFTTLDDRKCYRFSSFLNKLKRWQS